ncbi:hypothetical protein JCM10212_001405 [Sporobolomyces blumeae]
MSLIRPFSAVDLYAFNGINLDVWTETYGVNYYLSYLLHWSELFSVVESAGGSARSSSSYGLASRRARTTGASGGGEGGELMGYVMGKTEGRGKDWHGHVSAITVSPSHRRLGLASMLMDSLETVSAQQKGWFVDLFVRESNDLAIGLYESLGYKVYRRVKGYYGGGPREPDEDAFDMRKALPIDEQGESLILPNGIKDGRDWAVDPEDIVF